MRWVTATVLMTLVLAGCASFIAVPVSPMRGQEASQMDRDKWDCIEATQAEAKADPNQADDRQLAFAGCMVVRGYRPLVTVGRSSHQNEIVALEVTTAKTDRVEVTADLRECETTAIAARNATPERFADRLTAKNVARATLLAVPMKGPKAEVLAATFTSCLSGRGYDVTPWGAR
jgi:hypothetical protein